MPSSGFSILGRDQLPRSSRASSSPRPYNKIVRRPCTAPRPSSPFFGVGNYALKQSIIQKPCVSFGEEGRRGRKPDSVDEVRARETSLRTGRGSLFTSFFPKDQPRPYPFEDYVRLSGFARLPFPPPHVPPPLGHTLRSRGATEDRRPAPAQGINQQEGASISPKASLPDRLFVR